MKKIIFLIFFVLSPMLYSQEDFEQIEQDAENHPSETDTSSDF